MNNSLRATAIALGFLASGGLPMAHAANFTVHVGVHDEVSISNARITEILSKVRRSLFGACSQDAVSHAKRYDLEPNLPTPVQADLAEHRNMYRDTNTSVQIVPQISTCGGKGATPTSILGCAAPTGPILVRKRPNTNLAAQLWAHEIGHAQGLTGGYPGYVKGHNQTSGSLMFPSANPKNWSLSPDECSQYFSAQNFPPAIAVAALVEAGGEIEIEMQPLEAEVPTEAAATTDAGRDFLGSEFFHGLDIGALEENLDVISRTARAVFERREFEYWPNAVLVAGYVNENWSLDALNFVLETADIGSDFSSVPDDERMFYLNEAKVNVGYALGYLGYQGDTEAIFSLRELLSPSNNLAVPFVMEVDELESLAKQLAVTASVGLALVSANFEPALETLSNHEQAATVGAYDLGVDETFFESLGELREFSNGKNLREILESPQQ